MLVGMLHTLPVVDALALQGVREDGERILVINAEVPARVEGFEEPVSKETLERFHIESFRADHVLRFGAPPFDSVTTGANPPDFEADGEAVDCVTFADHNRRVGFKLMKHLRSRLVESAGQRDFSGVAGCVISIWFGSQMRDLPPKNWDDSLIDPLLDAIADCHVDHEGIARLNAEVAERGFPQTMPPVVATARLPNDAAGFVANAVAAPNSGVQFSTGLGFDVELARQNDITETSARAHLERLVTSHDKPQIQHLLITAGGPDAEGFRYPGEELTAGFLAELPNLSVRTQYLQKVTLHFWSARQIGRVPVHH